MAAIAGGAGATAKGGLASAQPADVGRKFTPDGRIRAFAGNTVICHLPQQGPGSRAFDGFLDVYRDLATRRFAQKMALLPTSSYHMTIFSGANDQNRQPGAWPAAVPLDAPMGACDRWIAERLRGFPLKTGLPIRMKVSDAAPQPAAGSIQIRLEPADAGEERKLRGLRDRLAEALTIRAVDHHAYKFHVSLAYLIQWLTPEEEANYVEAYSAWLDLLREAAPIIELGAPEFCTFRDMFAFKTEFRLG